MEGQQPRQQNGGLDAVRDVQVLSPMNRGATGARSLNVELQKVLNIMSWDPVEGKYVLVNTVPHKEWCLAQLPGKRGVPIKVHEDVKFTDLGEAEWHIFKMRWKKHTGADLALD